MKPPHGPFGRDRFASIIGMVVVLALGRVAPVSRGEEPPQAGVEKVQSPVRGFDAGHFFGDRNGTGESSDKVELHYFADGDPGAFVSVSGGGVLASSSHPEAAQAFLAFVTGPEGQAIVRDGDSFEYAIGSGVASNPALRPLAELDYPKVDPSILNAAEVVALMTAAGVL